jgi:glyoxylase-like metal-dependent hydrolase (beta-lactamase superfamily II)
MANAQENELHYPLGDALPPTGTSTEVAPGVRWLRMSLPFVLDHINLWLLEDTVEGRPGWTLVDCGIANEDTRAAWQQVFATQLQGRPVLRVIVTHMHPDHIGLAHWLARTWDCRLWISATDFEAAHRGSLSTVGFGGERAAAFFASHGLNHPEAIAKVRERADYYARLVPEVPEAFRRLMDGMSIGIGGHEWTCIAGYGHAPEHMALHCASLGVLISGDMVLPRISTNVSVHEDEPEANPLALYLESLGRYETLPGNTLVLPSHGKPFVGLHTRVRQLREHHDLRLADAISACGQRPCCASDLLPVLFKRKLDLHQTTFAMGESVAHLHALWFAGRLERSRDADGVWRFTARP